MAVRFNKGGPRGGRGTNAVEDYLSRQFDTPFSKQAAPAAKTTSTLLTAAELMGRLITGNQGASGGASYQLPTGTNVEAALKAAIGRDPENDDSFEWSVINLSTAAAEVITITAASAGNTVVGDMTIACIAVGDTSSGRFCTRRTAANVYVTYRIA
jgi:hypothetical protein